MTFILDFDEEKIPRDQFYIRNEPSAVSKILEAGITNGLNLIISRAFKINPVVLFCYHNLGPWRDMCIF